MPFWSKAARRDDHADSERLRCSFCNKDQNDVRKLIAGPTVFICDECVEVCVDIIADDTRFTTPAHDGGDTIAPAETFAPTDDSTGDSTVDCVICQAAVPVSQGLTIPGRGMLCADCEDAVVLAVDNRWPADE